MVVVFRKLGTKIFIKVVLLTLVTRSTALLRTHTHTAVKAQTYSMQNTRQRKGFIRLIIIVE